MDKTPTERTEKEEMWYQLSKPPLTAAERNLQLLIANLKARAEK